MSDTTRPDRGPADEFEIVWKTGHTERLAAHQVSCYGGVYAEGGKTRRITFHAEVNGRWTLLLDAREDDLVTVRNVTQVGL